MKMGTWSRKPRGRTWAIGVGACAVVATSAVAATFGPWGTPVSAEQGSDPSLNTFANDGCPILSPDGLSLFIASNRPGGMGNLLQSGVMDNQDIWVATRATTTSGWGAPVNLGAPVNSTVDDFCPTPAPGNRLFFVSRRDEPNGDIYVTTRARNGTYAAPTHLGPNINSPFQEWSPAFYTDYGGRDVLYFSSTRPGGPGATADQDIYWSLNYGPAQLAPGNLNTEFDDSRPNVSRDGTEIVFDSLRNPNLGTGPDVWTSKRSAANRPWPAATHLPQVSSPVADTRASLSWDGTFLLVGSPRAGGEGMADVYVSTRNRTR